MKNVIFIKAPGIKNRREMSMWPCLARQRSGLLVIFLLLLAITLYKELFEGKGEEQASAVTGNKRVRRIFELEVKNSFDGQPGKLTTEVETVKAKVSEVEESEVEADEVEEKLGNGKTQPRCHFRAPTENRTVTFPCGQATGFISIVKSVCKTQLGNQLSSFATLVYFQVKYGMRAFLDPAQTKALGQVFDKAALGIGAFDFYRCGCHPGQQNWVRPLEVDEVTGVATALRLDPSNLTRSTLIGLGAHTTPVFLFKQVLEEARERLKFKPRILELAQVTNSQNLTGTDKIKN